MNGAADMMSCEYEGVYRDLNYKENESADMNGAADYQWMAELIDDVLIDGCID